MLYDILKFVHVISFVFMSIPLFNLIAVNERAKFGPGLNYYADHYMENIIRGGVKRCYVFQSSVLISGILLLIYGPLGIEALYTNWILLIKTILLFALMGSLSYVHLYLQQKIDAPLNEIKPDSPISDEIAKQIKPYRVRRKKLAANCLFFVITTIILGMQVFAVFTLTINAVLILLAALFSWRAYKSLIQYGWI